MPYLGECGEQRVAEHGLIQPWVRRIRCGTSIDCGGRAVPRGRSAHSRCNGHDRRDHDPMSHLSLLRSLSLALGCVTAKAGARRSYSSAVVEEQLRCRIRATSPGADPCRSAYEHKPAPRPTAASSQKRSRPRQYRQTSCLLTRSSDISLISNTYRTGCIGDLEEVRVRRRRPNYQRDREVDREV